VDPGCSRGPCNCGVFYGTFAGKGAPRIQEEFAVKYTYIHLFLILAIIAVLLYLYFFSRHSDPLVSEYFTVTNGVLLRK